MSVNWICLPTWGKSDKWTTGWVGGQRHYFWKVATEYCTHSMVGRLKNEIGAHEPSFQFISPFLCDPSTGNDQ